MGWGRMLLLGNWGQQMDIQDQKAELQHMRSRLRRQSQAIPQNADSRIAHLEKENDELKLYLAALVRYMAGKDLLNMDEFKNFVDEIDAEDGSADGKFDGNVV